MGRDYPIVDASPLTQDGGMTTKKAEIPKYAGPTSGYGTGRGGQEENSMEGVEGEERKGTVEGLEGEPIPGGIPQGGTEREVREGVSQD